MPIKRQAVKIKSSLKSASKGSVKAKKVVSTSGYGYGSRCKKKTGYGYKKKAHAGKKSCKRVVRKSAFRAVSAQPQTVAANTEVRVAFTQEQYDLGGEYNPLTSTFRARQNGIYTFIASVIFLADIADSPNAIALLGISVNNNLVAAETTAITSRILTLDVSTIVRLRSGDTVHVVFDSTVASVIDVRTLTHFEGVLNRATS